MRRPSSALLLHSVVVAALVTLAAAPLHAQAREALGQSSPTLTPAIRVGNMVYASGQLPSRSENADTSIAGQTRSTLENVKRVFEMAGTTMANVTKCTVYLIDGADFQGMNAAYREFWPVAPPARTTVVVKALVVPGAKLEIECNAAMPAK
ncbi:MAG TPA: RidA family protein [Gemmatimonadaceae bacterium]|nr:RidA family protein [Gemmatimonadaceae bacterium]